MFGLTAFWRNVQGCRVGTDVEWEVEQSRTTPEVWIEEMLGEFLQRANVNQCYKGRLVLPW